MSNKYNACHIEDANREADSIWDMVEGQPDDDVTVGEAPISADQVNGWYQDGLISATDGFYLLTDRTV